MVKPSRPCKIRWRSALRPGMVFYDLGANLGLFTLLAARLVTATGKVFSFEPDPKNAADLRRNIQRNGFSNVTVVESGVWSTTGNRSFVAANADSPDHGVGKFVERAPTDSGTLISCVSLDDFIQTAPPPDAIKCDIEGAEAGSAARRRETAAIAKPALDHHGNAFTSPRSGRARHAKQLRLSTHGSRRASRPGRPCETMIFSCASARVESYGR